MRFLATSFLLLISLLLTCCSSLHRSTQDGPPLRAVNTANIPNATPRALPKSRYGNPHSYVVFGKRYYVLPTARGYNQRGIASWYGRKFHGQLTSSREPYNMYAMTAASPVLPIPCFVRVTNLSNGREVIVKVNDRGPFAPNRIIDLSYAAAKKLGYARQGTAVVQVTTISNHSTPSIPHFTKAHNPTMYLQLGAYAHIANARKVLNEAKHITQQPVLIKTSLNHLRTLYRVRVGPLKTITQSDQIQHTFAEHGFPNAITVVD